MNTGDKAFIKKKITEQDIILFSELSLDKNPVHLDDEYAKTTVFKKRIAHGMLSASLISAVIGTKLPGPGSIYVSQQLNFKAPVYINDEIKAEVEIISINEKNSGTWITCKTYCINQSDKIVLEGEAVLFK